ncbi:HisA/HisF-related TIM barrel protein [Candidatus Carsonella ruddii]|uniref:1-(5-phosphoribosyl)-5-[(5-phosphoribosylamino) me thylideneamino] imidazole-4-carboxamide isomerase n=1 Tax=Candidatus Carsonella ruddii (Diaphorina cf. continua) TaxID=2661587 RepID=A0A7R7AC25_CARRU|nr:HisA/HisF-related TIM barrel protein [Candidatus Carsonella ruddii (Diaphorina cf. continua)]BCG49290.1 1-(5-phosphoribosyl)-5-[(5-phosphoribosylamino) me thylideneamino] imidazole-4-carboxamide isomerase [Candidatus Carsonella ruddii (Diaphorina cf. continua)]
MIILSLDIYKNKIVRLYKGQINKVEVFGYIYEYIDFYNSINIKKLHIVSLDSIFLKKNFLFFPKNNIKIQIGGGIRSFKQASFYLNNNFKKIVLGSLLFLDKIEFKKMLSYYKKKIIISLDCFNNYIAINGWETVTKINFEIFFVYLFDINIKTIIYTNISKDGTLSGIQIKEIKFLINKKFLCKFIISGGISSYNDICRINKNNNFDFIIGLSIYKSTMKIKNI